MKKSLVALAALGLFSGIVAAQSSVTLFGVVDMQVRQTRNGSAGSVKALASGGLATSRFGVRGVEDLGGGLKAGFHLEAGITPDVGTADTAKFWGRRSTVSLISSWGELRLGRDYNPTALNTFAEPFGVVGVGSVGIFTYGQGSDLGSGATTVLRNDNAISYILPSMGGIYGSAMVAAGEGTPGNKLYGARLGYAAGPIDAAVGYSRTTATVSGTDFVQANIKAIYDFGFAKLNTLFDQKKFGALKQKMIMVGATAPVGVGEVRVAFGVNNMSGGPAGSGFGDADDSKLISLGYVHRLSKRTALYTTASRLTNDGAARKSVNFTAPAGMLGGENSSGYELGVSHVF
jgi:predicted porin